MGAKPKRKKRETIDWQKNLADAKAWFEKCKEVGITPTTTQIQKHFGWTQTVASKVKTLLTAMEGIGSSKESMNGEHPRL